jgi:hypothetical protein
VTEIADRWRQLWCKAPQLVRTVKAKEQDVGKVMGGCVALLERSAPTCVARYRFSLRSQLFRDFNTTRQNLPI